MGKFRDKGKPIDNVSNYSSATENIVAVASQSELNLYRLIFVTKLSMMKVVDGGEFDVAKRTVAATKLLDDDEVISVVAIKEQRNIVLKTNDGYFLRFPIEEIPEKKKAAVGVRGMKLSPKDFVEEVFYTQNAVEQNYDYNGRIIALNSIKLGKRDSKGTKLRGN